MTTTAYKSAHVVSVQDTPPQHSSEAGSITDVTVREFPLLRGLSLRRQVLSPLAVREPQWQVNATELAFCVRGRCLVTMFAVGNVRASFLIEPGQMFYVPNGAMHHIENVGDDEAEIVSARRHEAPQEFGISSAFAAMSDAVLGNTFGMPAAAFSPVARRDTPTRIGLRRTSGTIPDAAFYSSPFKFDVAAMRAPVAGPAGAARTARQQFWPILDDISMYLLNVNDDGMREPHWHPITAEMGYVARGSGRMTVLDPNGALDTYSLKSGDVYFVPRAYPHHIEDLGHGAFEFLIFFDQPTPGDIGYRAATGVYDRDVLAAAFRTDPDALPMFPRTPMDPLLVPRVNPLDPP
jgi:oxalate decarboxylase